MKYTRFSIKNFKGIKDLTFELGTGEGGTLFPMVGLNESGKTTILEAINYFTYKSNDLLALNIDGYAVDDPRATIPIGKRHNFNEAIELSVWISLTNEDENYIRSRISENTGITLTEHLRSIRITTKRKFVNSEQKEVSNEWYISLVGKKNGSKGKSHEIKYASKEKELWLKCVKLIGENLPPILYFPNFMFEIPERIYLATTKKEIEPKNEFYCRVMQDILDAMGEDANIATHIAKRIESDDRNDKNNLNSLLLEVGKHISRSVFGSWSKIFKKNIDKKRILVDTGHDVEHGNYIQFRIEDDIEGSFLINERSLGFRWFFVFLLLTHYRNCRKDARGKPLFLFDEPASNLHPSAQEQLLYTFKDMARECTIIYTTHSHYLVSPDLLETTYVVKNAGNDDDVTTLGNRTMTDIRIYKYRRFVSEFPEQMNYFKPLLDVLQYAPSQLEIRQNTIILEGKNDYYFYELLRKMKLCEEIEGINFMPGTGSGSCILPMQVLFSWKYRFHVVFDDDEAGQKEAARAKSLFGPIADKVVSTYSSVHKKFAGMGIEKIIGEAQILKTTKETDATIDKVNKKLFWSSIHEKVIHGKELKIDEDVKSRFIEIIKYMRANL